MTEEIISGEAFDREIEDFDRKRHIVFEGLARELQQAAASPADTDFGKVVSHAQKVLGMSDIQMSVLFRVSRPTVNRWARGATAPHPMLRKAVFDSLLSEVRQALKKLRASA